MKKYLLFLITCCLIGITGNGQKKPTATITVPVAQDKKKAKTEISLNLAELITPRIPFYKSGDKKDNGIRSVEIPVLIKTDSIKTVTLAIKILDPEIEKNKSRPILLNPQSVITEVMFDPRLLKTDTTTVPHTKFYRAFAVLTVRLRSLENLESNESFLVKLNDDDEQIFPVIIEKNTPVPASKTAPVVPEINSMNMLDNKTSLITPNYKDNGESRYETIDAVIKRKTAPKETDTVLFNVLKQTFPFEPKMIKPANPLVIKKEEWKKDSADNQYVYPVKFVIENPPVKKTPTLSNFVAGINITGDNSSFHWIKFNEQVVVPENTTRVIDTTSYLCGTKKYIYNVVKNTKGMFIIAVSLAKDYAPVTAENAAQKETSKNEEKPGADTFSFTNEINAMEIARWLKTINPGCDSDQERIAEKIHDKIEGYKVNTVAERDKRAIDSLVALLSDFDRVAGEIKLNRQLYVNAIDGKNNRIPNKHYLVKVNKASLQIDKNRIQDITFDAELYNTDGDTLISKLNAITNNDYSLSFAGLNNRLFSRKVKFVSIETHEVDTFEINYADLINFRPKNNNYTFITQNCEYELKPDSITTIYRRRYSDYLSFRTFLDPLGFLGDKPNGFAQLEGDAVIPIFLGNHKKLVGIPYVHANFSYIYNNSINSEPRLARSFLLANDTTGANGAPRNADSVSYYVRNLDFVQKAYYQFYARASVFSLEFKASNSWLSLELGMRVLGTRVVAKDTFTVHKLIPELNICWELRPDNIFGANVNFGISYLANIHRANNDPLRGPGIVYNPSFLWKSVWGIPHEINIYVLTGKESKGGMFFRYNGWWQTANKLADHIRKDQLPASAEVTKTAYYPQILFGYSTNLSTLIKRKN